MNFNKRLILILASVLSMAFYFLFQPKEDNSGINLFVDKVNADHTVGPSQGTTEGTEGEGEGEGEGCGSESGEGAGSQGEGG